MLDETLDSMECPAGAGRIPSCPSGRLSRPLWRVHVPARFTARIVPPISAYPKTSPSTHPSLPVSLGFLAMLPEDPHRPDRLRVGFAGLTAAATTFGLHLLAEIGDRVSSCAWP